MRLRNLAVLACCFLLLAGTARSEEKKAFGRLRDGRAYRVDQDGVQLSDYIAELEVLVDDLRRQVIALQDELTEKNRKLARFEKQGMPPSEIFEKDLVPSEIPISRETGLSKENCRELVTALEGKVTLLENAAREKVIVTNRFCEERLASLRSSFENSTNQAAELDQTLSEKKGVGVEEKVDVVPENKGSEREKIALQSQLNEISKLIGRRKKVLEILESKNRNVSVRIQPLVTKSGTSLDTLRATFSRLDQADSIEQVSAGLVEIRNILESDIQVLERLAKG